MKKASQHLLLCYYARFQLLAKTGSINSGTEGDSRANFRLGQKIPIEKYIRDTVPIACIK